MQLGKQQLIIWLIIFTLRAALASILIVFCTKEITLLPAHLLVAISLDIFFLGIYDIAIIRLSRLIKSLYLSVYQLLWFIFYVCIIGGNFLWGQTVRLDLLSKHLPVLPDLLTNLQLPTTLIYLIFGIIVGLHFWSYYRFLSPHFRFLFDNNPFSARRTKLLLALAGISFLVLALPAKRWAHRQEEPLMVSIWGDEGSNTIVNELRLAEGIRDKKIKADYVVPDSFLRKNVVIIMVDAMRFDHLQMYGYQRSTAPFLEECYAKGALLKIRNARASCACSECGVSTTLFGKNWNKVGYNGFTLVSALKKAGYDTHFILSGYSHLWSPTYECFIPDLTQYIENIDYPMADDSCVLAGLKKIPSHPQNPQFLYLHLMSVHLAGIRHAPFGKFQPAQSQTANLDFKIPTEQFKNIHDNGILQADAFIREIFRQLEQKNILQNAIVIIMSDHGEGMGEHDLYRHTSFLYETVNRIPLLIYDSDFSPYKNTKFARQIDLAPTLLNRLGLPIPISWQGSSLLNDSIATYSYHQSVLKSADRFSLIEYQDTAAFKLMFNRNFTWTELYEILGDSLEQHELSKNPHYQAVYQRLKNKAQQEFKQQYDD